MADHLTPELRSVNMSKIKASNTKPELIVRKYLTKIGFKYRINNKKEKGKPDIINKSKKLVIFVNGCFWHGHSSCKKYRLPKSNLNYWKPKIERNIERDAEIKDYYDKKGYKVIVIWECEINDIETNLLPIIRTKIKI